MRSKFLINILLFSAAILILPAAGRADAEGFTITIKDHAFVPAELVIPANRKIKIVVKNEDSTPEEFESYDLNREKIVTGNGTISLFVGPLKPGEYKYFGEFHQSTAQGIIKAIENINPEEK